MAVLAFGWLGLAAFALFSANVEIRRGLRAVEAARGRADASSVVEGRLLPELRLARSEFASAHGKVDGPLLAPIRVLPFVGRQLRSVNALSGAATDVADAAIAGMSEAQPVLAEPGGSNAARAAAARRLGELAGRTERRLGQLSLGPRVGLLPPLARARNRLSTQVADLRDTLGKGAKGGAALADVLEGPRRYLLLAANNAEMRAGAGMLLSAGELETGPEGLRLSPMRSVTDIPVPRGTVPLTGDLADRWGWLEPNVEWRNLMTSPRFDAAAPLAADMWVAAGNRPVDGVMVLDPVALGGLLRGTGPVEVEGRVFDQDNVGAQLLHDQYLRFPDDETPERREELGTIARAAFAALDAGAWSLPRLATGLSVAGAGRHLLMWSSRAPEQAAWSALGVDGALRADSLLLSVLNRGGNKLDWFLRVGVEVTVRAIGSGSEVALTIIVENQVPVGEPRYVAGPQATSGVGEGVYLGILTVNMPAAATDARFDGVDRLAVAGDDGPSQVIGVQFDVPRSGTRTLVARFRLPEDKGAIRVEPSARVPPISWRSGGASWLDDSLRVLTYSAGSVGN